MTAPNSRFGKPNAKGRSSGIRSGRAGKAWRAPKGEPWVWQTRELLSSPAWKALSVNGRRLLDFLKIEYMNHAGTENGNLMATHEQLRAYGLSANAIRSAIEEAEFLGLLRFERGGRWAMSNQPSLYRLTFLPDRYGTPPTNEWKRVTVEQIRDWKADRTRERTARKNRKLLAKERVRYSQNGECRMAPVVSTEPSDPSDSSGSRTLN